MNQLAKEAENYPYFGEPSVIITFISGGLSSIVSRSTTAPLD